MATHAHSPASPSPHLPNGDTHTTPPVAPTAKKGKGKKEKPGEDEKAKLIAARLSQLEQEKAGAADQQAEVDKEVKKATRDLNQLMANIESPLQRLEVVHKKYEELVAEMKKLERDHSKSKKRADQLQKEQDKAKSEHNKTATMKDKLEKLCRELTKENKKVKDENKKLEESEKTARLTVNERLDQMLYDVQDVLNAKATSHGEKLHLELDELYVNLRAVKD
jgi:chromosome segregation ATPase